MVCRPGTSGLFLPALRNYGEQEWPDSIRAVLYLFGLLWLFMAVAIVSDTFMGAIEKITSVRKRKTAINSLGEKRKITVKVWNDTVANLTLMALGSSAPEILLSVIELVFLPPAMMSGDLGPSTIVGSAAFNLLCITAVCVGTIGGNEVRRIKDVAVFAVTALFSVIAYAWLLLIVKFLTPNVITIWEGAVTLMMFPLLVLVAYMADIGTFHMLFSSLSSMSGQGSPDIGAMSKEEICHIDTQIKKMHGTSIAEDHVAKMIHRSASTQRSRAAYRVRAVRSLIAGKRVLGSFFDRKNHNLNMASVVPVESVYGKTTADEECTRRDLEAIVDLKVCSYAVYENVDTGTVSVAIERTGGVNCEVHVEYATRCGTAKAGQDFLEKAGTLIFEAGETSKTVVITIIDDAALEEDEEFYFDLTKVSTPDQEIVARLGDRRTATIGIVDDEGKPGILTWLQNEDELHVNEGPDTTDLKIGVKRIHGSCGTVTCKYCTQGISAMEGTDYLRAEGVLSFGPGELENYINLSILPQGRYERTEMLRLVLSEPSGGSKFMEERDGGPKEHILTILIEPNPSAKDRVDRICNLLALNVDRHTVAYASWAQQFRCALLVNGGEDVEPNGMDYFMHAVTVVWKLMFAMIPPAEYCNGWCCFIVALLMIGLVTALIGDLAALLGCVVGISDSVTAITLVALGTSLPDTFASKAAAEQDPYADASLGNITGSNSVNVFLGLGLPWLFGAWYWAIEGRTERWQDMYRNNPKTCGFFDELNQGGGKFIVVGGDLSFNIIVFTVCAVLTLLCLAYRRKHCGGELGGFAKPKWATVAFLIFLWATYVTLCTIYSSVNGSTSSC